MEKIGAVINCILLQAYSKHMTRQEQIVQAAETHPIDTVPFVTHKTVPMMYHSGVFRQKPSPYSSFELRSTSCKSDALSIVGDVEARSIQAPKRSVSVDRVR